MSLEDLEKQNVYIIPEDKLGLLVRLVYSLSSPVGMGVLHHKPGPLPTEVETEILRHGRKIGRISMDYVLGRQCKMNVYYAEKENVWCINKAWYDHTKDNMIALLRGLGLTIEADALEKKDGL